MNKMPPKVSVSMITYNHEAFIAQAIESVLMQQCDFPFELVIGEDCSTDRTREIVRDYQEKHPDKIRLLLPETNLGMMRNFVQTMQACRGTYVALLEGDDYWTSPKKLQKQADYLDSHPECVTCFHDVKVVNDSDDSSYLYSVHISKDIFTLEDLLENNPVPNCSTMFRNGLMESFPEWYYEMKLGDWPLHVMNARHGSTAYLNEVMGIYRVHSGGVWSTQNDIVRLKSIVAMLHRLESFLEPEHTSTIKPIISRMNFGIFCASAQARQFREANRYLLVCLQSGILLQPGVLKRFGRAALQLYGSKLHRTGHKIKEAGQTLVRLRN